MTTERMRDEYAAAYSCFDNAADEDDDLGVAWKSDCLFMGIGVEKNKVEAKEVLFLHNESGEIVLGFRGRN